MISTNSGTHRLWIVILFGLGAWCGVSAQTTNAPAPSTADQMAAVSAPGLLPPSEIETPPDIVYATVNGVPLHARLSHPKNPTGLLPAIIYVHGGGWIHGDYRVAPTGAMAEHGYFAMSIEYRLSNVAKWPAQIEDCQTAVRWLRANAAQYHVDPNRVGAWGASAGGHLVACLATMADQTQYDVGDNPKMSSAVQAVVDFFGPTNFIQPGHYTPAATKFTLGLMGMPLAQDSAAWKSASPAYFVKAGDPPVLIVHGAADKLVPVAQSTDFDAALTQAGVEHQLILVKNGNHGFKPNPPGSTIDPSLAQISADVYTFFDAHLKKP